jgi:hypothetical protein
MNADQGEQFSKLAINDLQKLSAADAQVQRKLKVRFPFFLCVLRGDRFGYLPVANCYLPWFISVHLR